LRPAESKDLRLFFAGERGGDHELNARNHTVRALRMFDRQPGQRQNSLRVHDHGRINHLSIQ
jgi:hypothetical protein